MSLSTITTAELEKLVTLVKKRDSLKAEIAVIENQLASAFSAPAPKSAPATVKKTRRRRRKAVKTAKVAKAVAVAKAPAAPKAKRAVKTKAAGRKGRRGALKESVLAELKAAGAKGVSVKDLSAKLGVKNQNLHVWFSSTGKSIAGLKKVKPGTWALS